MIASQIVVGLALGLALTEWMFWKRDEGAFPHVNFYIEDPELGARLRPNATMRFRLHDNPLSTIHVNAQGYRGEDWPAPGNDEIVVLGDSQVFGLGVEDDETFSAKLAAATGRTVINAGVPTYGPPEYMRLAEELLEQRKPETLVVVLNFLNDPFELERPNVDRHAVWDGWAVRRETAPEHVRAFPGRDWLYSESHAFYALRRWWHERDGEPASGAEAVDLGTLSEGNWKDLVSEAELTHMQAQTPALPQLPTVSLEQERKRLDDITYELEDKRYDLDRLIIEASEYAFDREQARIAQAQPGDIVRDEYSESSRGIEVTAAQIREATRARKKHLAKLLAQEQASGKSEAHELQKAQAELLAERKQLTKMINIGEDVLARKQQREQLAHQQPPPPPPPSLFAPWLADMQALCDRHGAELIVVALPFDVQVDPAEWDKYGVTERPDMSGTLALLDDLVASAKQIGVRAVDVTAALRSAQPGAFLNGDIHMTAKGHAALGEALVERLSTPLPVRTPDPGLPEGMSFAPEHREWLPEYEVRVKDSSKVGCSTQIEGDWFRMVCRGTDLGGIEVREGASLATMTLHTAEGISLVTPLTIGEPVTARIWWADKVRELEIRWPEKDGKPRFVGELVEVAGEAGRTDPPDTDATELCALLQETVPGVESCSDAWGDPKLLEPCRAAHGEDDKAVLACVQNDPLVAPPCPEGSVHAFAVNACFPLCDDAHPCSTGTCTPWQASGVCR